MSGRYDPGGWLAGRLFPRRSDLSPDGRLLCYFAHKPGATWVYGDTYVAVAKLPWLTALHAFATCGTWTRGYYFTDDAGDSSDIELPGGYRLRPAPVAQFATERRRGWQEAAHSPARGANDFWDQRRNAVMQKRQPGGERLLRVESLGWAGGEFGVGQAVDGLRVSYSLESGTQALRLDDVQWADWDADGRLLVATRDGRLAIRQLHAESKMGNGFETVFEQDLSLLEPNPTPAPAWARRW